MARLTIPDEQTYATFTAAAQAVFPISFALLSGKADLRVRVDTQELTQGDFTFSGTMLDGGGYSGGTVTLNTAVTGAVRIWRDTPPQRTTNFAPSNTVPVGIVDQALNRLTAQQQDLGRRLDDAVSEAGSSIGLIGKTDTNLGNGVYTAPFTGAAPRSLVSRLGLEVWVDDFRWVVDLDDTNAFARARAYLQAASEFRGGVLHLSRRTYHVAQTQDWASYLLAHNITIKGQGYLSTFVDFSNAPADSDGFTFGPGGGFDVLDMTIASAPRDGISVNPGATPFVGSQFAMQSRMDGLRIQYCGRDGIRGVNWFLATFGRVWTRNNGLDLDQFGNVVSRTGWGINLLGGHTTVSIPRSVYAEYNGLGGVSVNGLAEGEIRPTVDRNYGPGLFGTNLVSVTLGAYGEENRESFIKLRTSNASAVNLPADYQNILVDIRASWSWSNSFDTPGAFAGLLDIETADGRSANVSMSVVRDAAKPGGTAAHFPIRLAGTNGNINFRSDTEILVNGRYQVTGIVHFVNERTAGAYRPGAVVPGTLGGVYNLPPDRNEIHLNQSATITGAYRLVLPRYPKHGESYRVSTLGAINTLTVDPTADGLEPARTGNGPTSLPAGGFFVMRYYKHDVDGVSMDTWRRVG